MNDEYLAKFLSAALVGAAAVMGRAMYVAREAQAVRSFVTDANATTFNSVVAGGGSNAVPVFSDGTAWRIG